MIIKNNIAHKQVTINNKITIECIGIRLSSSTYIVGVYNNPSNHFKTKEIDRLFKLGNKVLIIGDFNARHPTWNNNNLNSKGRKIYNYISKNNCSILYPNEHTHYPTNGQPASTIDIALNKNIRNISEMKVLYELSSDHNPVTVELRSQDMDTTEKIGLDYKNANWKAFRNKINQKVTINAKIDTKEQIEKEVHKLTRKIQHTIAETIPKTSIKQMQEEIPAYIKEMIKNRNKTRKQWQKHRLDFMKRMMNNQTANIRKAINEHRNKEWERKLKMINPKDKSLWKLTKALKKESKPIPTLIENNIEAMTDKEKAEMLADQFEKVHNIDLTKNTPEQNLIMKEVQKFLMNETEDDAYKYYTSPKEINKICASLPSTKAPGADGIQNIILKNLPRKAIVQLMYIINASIKQQYFPSNWKTGIIVPIHKTGKREDNASSYRPISLLPTMSKVLEKILHNRIKRFEKKNNIVINEQFGFRENHSTVQQIVRIVNDVTTNFNKELVTVMLLIDIEKAFDRVWTTGLIYKLIKQQYPPIIIKFIASYIRDRHLTVQINNIRSSERPIRAGVPQGTVLGPQLFKTYLNDLPTFSKTKVALFADDTAIYTHSFNAIIAAKQIQTHMTILEPYYQKWKIHLNASKTEVIVLTKKKKERNNRIFQPITVHGHKVSPTKTVKYLGVHLDTGLFYRYHIMESVKKAHAVLRKLYPLMVYNSAMTISNKKLLYKMIIRPIITYAAPVWCGAAATNINILQVMQNKLLRLILTARRNTRITDLHEKADVQYIGEYCNELAVNFYKNQLQSNPLTKNLTAIREHNIPANFKHKLPYQKLSIFYENN